MKFLEHLLISIIWVAVIAAGCWFGAPLIWQHLQQAEQAVQTVKTMGAAQAADTSSANAQQASCSAEIKGSMAAQRAILRAAQVQAIAPGKAAPLIGADQLQAIIQ